MPSSGRALYQMILRKLHLYIALVFGAVIILISASGSILVWRDHVDSVINPGLYSISGTGLAQAPDVYLASALAASAADQRVAELVYPQSAGWPVRVYTRGVSPDGRPRGGQAIYLDPPTGKVLGRVGISDTLVGKFHNFHHMLSAPQIGGRQIVGWFGIAMLALAVSGVILWWPPRGYFLRALKWRRSTSTAANIHHFMGFWISVPLSAVSLTGVYLSFPNTAFQVTSSIMSVSGPMSHGYGAIPTKVNALTLGSVEQKVLALAPGSILSAVSFPTISGHLHSAKSSSPPSYWTVRTQERDGQVIEYSVDDASGIAQRSDVKPLGDRVIEVIKSFHEGRIGGTVWAIAAFTSGILPAILLITGIMMWSRRVRRKQAAFAVNSANALSNTAH